MDDGLGLFEDIWLICLRSIDHKFPASNVLSADNAVPLFVELEWQKECRGLDAWRVYLVWGPVPSAYWFEVSACVLPVSFSCHSEDMRRRRFKQCGCVLFEVVVYLIEVSWWDGLLASQQHICPISRPLDLLCGRVA